MGWFFVKKHPDVIQLGKQLDFSDLMKDPIIRFQKKYYFYCMLVCCYVLPSLCGYYFFDNVWNGLFIGGFLRHILTLHATWSVNSFAHSFGYRPYNDSIEPTENGWVTIFTNGEGYHNFHHEFPYDYSASEFRFFNCTTLFIDFMIFLGFASNPKKVNRKKIYNNNIYTNLK